MKKLFIFDLDGTILDTVHTIAYYVNDALKHFGFPENETDAYKYFAGNGATNLIHRSLAAHGLDTEDNFNKVYPYYMEQYNKNTLYKTAHFKGLPETLKALKEKGIALAVVSNKPDGPAKLLCAQYFPGVYALGEASDCPRKPAPDMLYKAMKAIGVDRCLYVGDSEVDVVTAKNAGAKCLSVLWGFRDRADMEEVGGEYFCEKPADLLMKLEELM